MSASTDVVICEPLRTPVGRMGGALAQLSATELAVVILSELARRTGLGEGDVDDVILGNGYANGESPSIGRRAALDAGLGTGVPGLQIDRRCGSGLQAVLYGAAQVATGAARLVVAGGAESMSNVEHYALGLRSGVKQGGIQLMDRLDRARETAGGASHPVPGGMIETAENLRKAYNISREEQDELAVRSHHRAVAAHQAGKFADELVPVTVPGTRGKPDTVIDRDENPRADATQCRSRRPIPTRPSRAWARFARFGSSSIPSQPSPPATPPGRTTAPQCASSPPAPRPTGAGWSHCWRCGPGR